MINDITTDAEEGMKRAVDSFKRDLQKIRTGRGFLAGDPTHVALGFGLPLLAAVALSVWAFRGLRSAEAAG